MLGLLSCFVLFVSFARGSAVSSSYGEAELGHFVASGLSLNSPSLQNVTTPTPSEPAPSSTESWSNIQPTAPATPCISAVAQTPTSTGKPKFLDPQNSQVLSDSASLTTPLDARPTVASDLLGIPPLQSAARNWSNMLGSDSASIMHRGSLQNSDCATTATTITSRSSLHSTTVDLAIGYGDASATNCNRDASSENMIGIASGSWKGVEIGAISKGLSGSGAGRDAETRSSDGPNDESMFISGASTRTTGDPSSGQHFSLAPTNLAGVAPTGDLQIAQDQEPTTSAAVVTIGAETYTVASGGAIILGSTTVIPGGPAATVSSQAVSIASNGVAVGSKTASYLQPLAGASQPQPTAIITVESQAYTIAAGGSLNVGSTTVAPGGSAATISGQVVSVAPQGVVVGSKTIAYSASALLHTSLAASSSETVITFGVQTHSTSIVAGGPIVMGSTTLSSGAAATISGTVISMGPSGIIIGSSTLPYIVLPSNGVTLSLEPVLTLGGLPITAASGSSFFIGGQTLTPGGVITAASSTISLSPSGPPAVANINGVYQTLSSAFADGETPSARATFTIGSQVITASELAGNSDFAIIGSRTLTLGGSAATIAGQAVSYGQNRLIVGGTQTVSFFTASLGTTLAPVVSEAIFTIESQPLTAFGLAGSSGIAILGSQTLTEGGSDTTIFGQEVSLGSSDIVLGGSLSAPFSAVPNIPTNAVASVSFTGTDGAVETAFSISGSDGAVVIDATTLNNGGPAVTVDGQVVSEASGGLVVGSSTIPFSTLIAPFGSVVPTGSTASSSGSGDPGIAGLSDANAIDARSYLAIMLWALGALAMFAIV